MDHAPSTATKSYDQTIPQTVADAKKFLAKKNKEQHIDYEVSEKVRARRMDRREAYSRRAIDEANRYMQMAKSKGKVLCVVLLTFLTVTPQGGILSREDQDILAGCLKSIPNSVFAPPAIVPGDNGFVVEFFRTLDSGVLGQEEQEHMSRIEENVYLQVRQVDGRTLLKVCCSDENIERLAQGEEHRGSPRRRQANCCEDPQQPDQAVRHGPCLEDR